MVAIGNMTYQNIIQSLVIIFLNTIQVSYTVNNLHQFLIHSEGFYLEHMSSYLL